MTDDLQAARAATRAALNARNERILELARGGMSDPEIGRTVGLSATVVRIVRTKAGVPPGAPKGGQPRERRKAGAQPWEVALREHHAAGLTDAETAERMGLAVTTVRNYRLELGLAANRRRNA